MPIRKSVSSPQNSWFDAENVDDSDLTLEQDHNTQVQSSIIDNHFGSGILQENLTQPILFDSLLATGLLDGIAINPQNQPSDTNNGNQIEIQLTNSLVAGKRKIKVIIIGLDFQNNLQYEIFIFATNESQISSKHYRSILTILFNDFIGPPLQSLNLGGRIVIKEAKNISLSRDAIMVAQDAQPNLTFRDFFVIAPNTLNTLLTTALPNFNINTLNINTGFLQLRSLVENDISSQIGEKFLATTNNIQKITLLLSVINNSNPSNLVWTGDLLVSLYALQTTVASPSDLVPNLAIEFDPSNIPLAQISLNYNELSDQGIILNTVPQPVDFVFSNTAVGSGLLINPGAYYAVAIKRAGSPDTGQIQLATGTNTTSNYRETLFNGSIWVDVPQESLWFQVWTDAAKLSDGQAYDNGIGIQIPKTQINSTTGVTQDYVLNQEFFVRNDVYNALLQADLQTSVPVQDERTGNPVDSQKEYIPQLSLLTLSELNSLQNINNPLVVGTITDQNVKSSNPGTNILSASFHEYGFVNNQIVFKIITDSTDGYRYDPNLNELVSELVNGDLNNAKIIPNISQSSVFYRIAKAELLTMIYGDVNGDGFIDQNDIAAAQKLLTDNLNVFPTRNQYITQTTFFVNDNALTWQIINPSNSAIIASGTDGILTVETDPTTANLHSLSAMFNSIINLDTYQLVITGSTNAGNNGTFDIINLIDNNDLIIRKHYYTSDTILQIFRADIDQNYQITSNDIALLSNYIELLPTFPPNAPPSNIIGTTFQVVRLTLENYIDRNDDYTASLNRASNLHTTPDIFLNGSIGFAGQNVQLNPISFNIIKQLTWSDSNIVVSNGARAVPTAFNTITDNDNNCSVIGVISEAFPQPPTFEPGGNDFFLPNNLIFNPTSNMLNADGSFYKVDLEIATISFIIPATNFLGEKTVNLLTDFMADFYGNGRTRLFYPAMKFSDCSNVSLNAFVNNQVRLNISLQSISTQLTSTDGYGEDSVIVDDRFGVNIDYSSGIMTLQFNNLYEDPVQQTLNTKVQITVYLKKAGWNNAPIIITSDRTLNLLGL